MSSSVLKVLKYKSKAEITATTKGTEAVFVTGSRSVSSFISWVAPSSIIGLLVISDA